MMTRTVSYLVTHLQSRYSLSISSGSEFSVSKTILQMAYLTALNFRSVKQSSSPHLTATAALISSDGS